MTKQKEIGKNNFLVDKKNDEEYKKTLKHCTIKLQATIQ